MSAFKNLLLAAALGATVVSTGTAAQARGPNILVVSEDADKDTIPRNNRAFNRVLAEISEAMIAKGFQVYDETAVSLQIAPPGTPRRTDAELITVARAISRPPIDLLVSFQIYASAKKVPFARFTRPEVRVAGRLLNIKGGQNLGFFEAGGDLDLEPLPLECTEPGIDKECLLEKVGMQARSIGSAVGQALAIKLSAYMRADDVRGGADLDRADAGGPPPPPVDREIRRPREALGDPAGCSAPGFGSNPFVLRFRNFESREINQLEEYMTAFRCYEHHRPIRCDALVCEYWYETSAQQAALQRNLRIALEYLDVKGQVSSQGNTILIDKIVTIPRR